MLPSPRHRQEAREARRSASPAFGPKAACRAGAVPPPRFTVDAVRVSPPLLPWRSGELWRVVSGGARPEAAAQRAAGDDNSVGDEDSCCRFCFGEADTDDGGELLEPCACSGSQRFVHTRCLRAWQERCLLDGKADKAFHCDVCRGCFSSKPPRLPLRQQALVALRGAAFHAARAWILATAAACAAGTAGGVLASADFLTRALLRFLPWLDARAASSATFATLASLALPAALPAAAMAASAVVTFHATFGAIFGLFVGVAGGPLLALRVVLALCRGTGRAAEAAATLALAAAAARR